MRIIAGTARSLPLKTIEGADTRPTTDRIKETLFNMLHGDIPGCYFLDLFAGSGQIGLEALSRGAAYTVFVENSKKVIETLETRSYVFRHVGINKIIKQTTTPIIRDGKIRGLLTVSSDVTKEENLKASLIDKNYQLNTLLKTLPLLVYMKDKDRNLIVASDNARNFVFNGVDAYSDDIVIDMEQAEQESENEDNYVLQNKKPLKKEKAAVDKDGKLHWYKISKAPIINSKNEVNGLVSIAKNIDKEKQLEKQRDLFLATLTHDLKNPLQAQISSLEMLYKEYYGKIDAEHQEIMELVIESSKYMRDMLCTLLKTCRDNSGIIQLER